MSSEPPRVKVDAVTPLLTSSRRPGRRPFDLGAPEGPELEKGRESTAEFRKCTSWHQELHARPHLSPSRRHGRPRAPRTRAPGRYPCVSAPPRTARTRASVPPAQHKRMHADATSAFVRARMFVRAHALTARAPERTPARPLARAPARPLPAHTPRRRSPARCPRLRRSRASSARHLRACPAAAVAK